VLNNIGTVHFQRKDYAQALTYFVQAAQAARSIHVRVDLLKSYENMTTIYAIQKNYQQAYFYEKQVATLKDTIFNEGNRDRIATMQTFFDSEKHKTELDLVKKDQEIKQDKIQQQRLFLYLVVSAAFLLSVIILLQWKTMQNKKLTAQQLLAQNNEINEQRKQLEIKNKDVQSSIEYAQRIQTAILPTETQIQETLPQSFVLYMPRDIVSGDFYWFAEVKSQEIEVRDVQHDLSGDRLAIRFDTSNFDDTIESRLVGYEKQTKAAIDPLLASNFYHMTPKAVIAVVDCTGHGVPGAFMSMIGNDLLNEIVKEKNIHSPELILSELHKGVKHVLRQDNTDNKDGMDAVVCVIDKQHEVIEFAGAMNPIYVVQDYSLRIQSEYWTSITKFRLHEQSTITHFDNQLFEIKGDKRPIGGGGQMGNSHRTYTKHTIALAADQQHIPTTIYLCTDGYQDQFGGQKNKKFMARQLKSFLQEIHTKPLREQKQLLLDKHLHWKTHNEQTDDILIMAVRV
jgi:serine phosphatase RsbU (regulator of sigma subunit)